MMESPNSGAVEAAIVSDLDDLLESGSRDSPICVSARVME